MFRRLIPYRDLLIILTWREFIIRYKHSMIGIFWAILQPLSLMLLFTFIFSYILEIETSSVAYPIFFYSGLLPWIFFSSALNYSIPSLTNHYNLITKIYFPREILPLCGIIVAFIDFLIAFFFFLILLFIYKVKLSLTFFWIIPLFVMLFIFTTAVSLLLSGLNVYYRDVKLATAFMIQVWFFASPVLYSIDRIDVKLKLLLFINPMTFIIENMRRTLIEGRDVVLWQFVLVTIVIIIFYVTAYRFFIRIERAFADVI